MKLLISTLAVFSLLTVSANACDIYSSSALNCQVANAAFVNVVSPSVAVSYASPYVAPTATVFATSVPTYGAVAVPVQSYALSSATIAAVQPYVAVQSFAVNHHVAVQNFAVRNHHSGVRVQNFNHGGVRVQNFNHHGVAVQNFNARNANVLSVQANGVNVQANGGSRVNVRQGAFGGTSVRVGGRR